MKKQLIYFTMLSCMSFLACKKEEQQEVAMSDCLNKTVDKPMVVADVKGNIYGEWQLRELIGNMPTKSKVPDLKIVFKDISGSSIDKQIADIYENGKLTNSMSYTLKQVDGNGYRTVQIVSDAVNFQNGDYNFLRGTIRTCENQMMIDNGIAFDAPGYIFTKVNVAK